MVSQRQQATVVGARWRAQTDIPGSQGASSLTSRWRGNQGDPPACAKGEAQSPTSDNKRGGGQGPAEVGGTHKSEEAW